MSTLELKTNLHHLIDETNDSGVLKALYSLLKGQKEATVAYTADMKPLTRKALIARVKKAEADVKKGKYTTIEQLEKESVNW